jgi:hypothetical protein
MDLNQLYIENCEGFDEYMPDGSCRNGLRMTLDGFQNALRKLSGQIEPQVIKQTAEAIRELLQLAQATHTYCEDGYYSCPKAEGGCYNGAYKEDECNCGADKQNERVTELKTILMNDRRLTL